MTLTATEAPAEAVEAAPTDKRKLALIGGVAAVALAAGGWFLLHGSGGSSGPALGLPAGGLAKPAAVKPATLKSVAKPAAKEKAALLVPAASTVKLGRDPFHALYIVPAAAPAAAVGTGTAAPGTSTSGTTGSSTGTSSGTSTTPAAPVSTTYALKLVRVYGAGKDLTAVFSVAGKTQLAKAGSVFGRSQEIKLLSMQQGAKGVWTAVIQVGDGQPFDAPTGEILYVQ